MFSRSQSYEFRSEFRTEILHLAHLPCCVFNRGLISKTQYPVHSNDINWLKPVMLEIYFLRDIWLSRLCSSPGEQAVLIWRVFKGQWIIRGWCCLWTSGGIFHYVIQFEYSSTTDTCSTPGGAGELKLTSFCFIASYILCLLCQTHFNHLLSLSTAPIRF